MSWLNNLAGKAENLLNILDENAANAAASINISDTNTINNLNNNVKRYANM